MATEATNTTDAGGSQVERPVRPDVTGARRAMSNKQCRNDGRCQYAIEAMVEELGRCPPGVCNMSASTPSTERLASADKYRALMFGLRDSYPGCTVTEQLDRWRWLKADATAAQWERAGHALDADAEIDAMRHGA